MSGEPIPDADLYSGGLLLQLGVLGVMGGVFLGGALGLLYGIAAWIASGLGWMALWVMFLGPMVGALVGLFCAVCALPFAAIAACSVTAWTRRRGVIASRSYVRRMRWAVALGGGSFFVLGFWFIYSGLFLGAVGAAYGVFAGDRVGRWVQRQAAASTS